MSGSRIDLFDRFGKEKFEEASSSVEGEGDFLASGSKSTTMATILCLMHCLTLFLYFTTRYVIDLLLRPIGVKVFSDHDDAAAYHVTDFAFGIARGYQRILRRLPRQVVIALAQIGIFLPGTRKAALSFSCSWKLATLILLKLVARNVQERRLWLALSAFITFTRESSGRTESHTVLKGAPTNNQECSSWRKNFRCFILRFIVPLLIWFGIFYWFVRSLVTSRFHASLGSILPQSSSTSKLDGFTAIIPSCYDGDTCHTQDLQFDGKPLPDLFSSLNVRVLGIDTPETRSAKCELERCLAERAKLEMERIIGAGNGNRVSLVECRHDKYGGRITCDMIIGDGGRSVADEMLETGLAVRYYGKRKTHSWCDQGESASSTPASSDPLYPHILACGWWDVGDPASDSGPP